MIDDVITQAGGVIHPLLSAGAGAAAVSVGGAAGTEMVETARGIVGRLRLRRDLNQPITRQDVVDALRRAVDEGAIEVDELRSILRVDGRAPVHNEISGGNVGVSIQGCRIDIGTFNAGGDERRG